jgi:hypothetical protein
LSPFQQALSRADSHLPLRRFMDETIRSAKSRRAIPGAPFLRVQKKCQFYFLAGITRRDKVRRVLF